MADIDEDTIRTVVAETLCEQQKIHHCDIDAVVDRAITTVLASFGIEEDGRRELGSVFRHLRRWRKSVEHAQGFTFKAVISIIVAGFLGALWLGIKGMVGKCTFFPCCW